MTLAPMLGRSEAPQAPGNAFVVEADHNFRVFTTAQINFCQLSLCFQSFAR
jgi:hypothetical protein